MTPATPSNRVRVNRRWQRRLLLLRVARMFHFETLLVFLLRVVARPIALLLGRVARLWQLFRPRNRSHAPRPGRL